MKTRTKFFMIAVFAILFFNIYVAINDKSTISYSLDNIEAIASTETYLFHTDCIKGISNDTEGEYTQKSCKEKDGDNKIYECKNVTTKIISSNDYGTCYTLIEL